MCRSRTRGSYPNLRELHRITRPIISNFQHGRFDILVLKHEPRVLYGSGSSEEHRRDTALVRQLCDIAEKRLESLLRDTKSGLVKSVD